MARLQFAKRTTYRAPALGRRSAARPPREDSLSKSNGFAAALVAGAGVEHLIGEWGSFFLDGGYEFQNYFEVVEQLSWGPSEAPGALTESTGDFGFDGFFFRGGFRFAGP